jgi:hypothetical protein
MNKAITARLLRLLLVAGFVGVTFAVVLGGLAPIGLARVVLPFLAATMSVAGLVLVLPRIDRVVQRVAHHPSTTPYSALAKAAARLRAGSLEQALPGLARVLAEGTQAQRAVLWLAVEEKLVSAASYPSAPDPVARGSGARGSGARGSGAPGSGTGEAEPRVLANLAVLLAQPEVDHVVPVLDGSVLRAALAIGKPGRPVTPSDQRLMQDVANGAGLLLRGVQLNAELVERVRRADELATELQASRQRLTQARDVERHRLVAELTHMTTDRLAALRTQLTEAQHLLTEADVTEVEQSQHALQIALIELDELIERFRLIARGVYPAVLRDQGPYGALDELSTDLRRPVHLSGTLSRRLAWEVESGIYYLTVSALHWLDERLAPQPVHVHLEHTEGRLVVHISDPTLATAAEEVLRALTDDVDRLAALGGQVELTEDDADGATLRAWLPDRLEPSVEGLTRWRARPVGSAQVSL